MDKHPKRCWKAADASISSATLSVQVQGKTGGLGMVRIIADAVAVTISDPNGINWRNVDWQNVDWITVPDDLHLSYEFNRDDEFGALWVNFDQFEAAVDITITLYKAAGTPEILSAGSLVVGEMEKIPGLQYPIGDDLVDYSLSRELSNGASYYKKRDIVRRLSGTIRLPRLPDFYNLQRRIARKYGSRPLMWNLMDCMAMEFVVYGKLQAMPSGSHENNTRSTIDFELLEVL